MRPQYNIGNIACILYTEKAIPENIAKQTDNTEK